LPKFDFKEVALFYKNFCLHLK